MNINQAKFNEVVAGAKAKAAGHPEWLRAITKAAAAILDGSMIVTTLQHGAVVTTDGGSYHANGACDCPARTQHCYHRAGARLMALYEEAACEAALPVEFRSDVATTPRRTLIIEIKAAWPSNWPPLPVELMARFRCNDLNFLDDDQLRRVRLAIAM